MEIDLPKNSLSKRLKNQQKKTTDFNTGTTKIFLVPGHKVKDPTLVVPAPRLASENFKYANEPKNTQSFIELFIFR